MPSGYDCVRSESTNYGVNLSEWSRYLSRCIDPNCIDCAADHSKCTVCDTNFIIVDNACFDCGDSMTETMKAVLKTDRSGLECKDTADLIYYGSDVSTTTNVLLQCSSSGCIDCAADHTSCHACSPNHMLHQNECYPCGDTPIPTTDQVLVLADNLEALVCVDKTTDPYSVNYGQDVTQLKGVWAKCQKDGCTNCRA